MAGASPPGAASRPLSRPSTSLRRFHAIVADLDAGATYAEIRASYPVSDRVIQKADAWRAQRGARTPAPVAPPPPPAAPEPPPAPVPFLAPPLPDLSDLAERLAAVASYDAVGRAFLIADLELWAQASGDPDDRAHYEHLADLVRHHGTPYPSKSLAPSRHPPLVLLPATAVHGLGSSPAAACVDF